MSFFFQYLLRLSVCFAIMYLFYAIVLRRLTFYNHNRWYLLGYSLLCFFIPLISISTFSQNGKGIVYSNFVHMIPTVTVTESAKTETLPSISPELMITGLFIIGVAVMVIRLLIQFFSFKKLTENVVIISDADNVKLYQIDKDIVPFSFGNSIYINRELSEEKALREILRHEFVHVKQKHTIDILWSELLCILNWYNPFVWLIRKAVRENLEFIADNKVVQSGINKQQYQYLLLRVMGNNNFSFTINFNFSSLKKRITMMNKIKSAKIHLLKFLFLIPVSGVLLISFRDIPKQNKKIEKQTGITNVMNVNEVQLQNQDTSKKLSQVQSEPKFPGGPKFWAKYLQLNLNQNIAKNNGAPAGQYPVVISFLINKDGSISEIKAIKVSEPDYGTAEEAVRVIKNSGNWIPATINGNPVTYRQKQRIIFTVTPDSKKK